MKSQLEARVIRLEARQPAAEELAWERWEQDAAAFLNGLWAAIGDPTRITPPFTPEEREELSSWLKPKAGGGLDIQLSGCDMRSRIVE